MKISFNIILIALLSGFAGGFFSQYFFTGETVSYQTPDTVTDSSNPFQIQTESKDLNVQLEKLQQKISLLEIQLNEFSENKSRHDDSEKPSSRQTQPNRSTTPSTETLTAAGINQDIADDILRRISEQQFRRLELQNLMQRSDPSTRRQYSQELRELNENKILLRTELGDEAYDKYLFISGQNNRVKVSSVMAGSPAESSGFQSNDVILYYDNQKILNWADIRKATIEGEIGSYTSVEILRDGVQMSLMVPRGTLGVQLDTTQQDPSQ